MVVGNRKNNKNHMALNEVANDGDDVSHDGRKKAHRRSRESVLKKIEDLDGKVMKRKEPFFARYVSRDSTPDDSSSGPVFPSYEEVDDDDLL